MSLLIGNVRPGPGAPSAFGILVVVVISLVGLAVIVLGLRGASVAQQRFGDELRARQAELSVQDGDPRVPPSSQDADSAGAFTLTPVARYRDGVQMLQTLSSPVLAILRARAGGNLESVKPYVVPSLYQRLDGQTFGLRDGRYRLYMWDGASVPEVQAMRVGLSTKGSDERWTLVRSHNLIQCRSCGGSVSGALADKCPSCGTACTGFEAGWRVLDITAA